MKYFIKWLLSEVKKLSYGDLDTYRSSDIATGPYNVKDIK